MCLAVFKAVPMQEIYVLESHFEDGTDLQALKWVLELKESSWYLARWLLRLLRFYVEVVHSTGSFKKSPNAFLRLFNIVVDKIDPHGDVLTYAITVIHDLGLGYIIIQQTDWCQTLGNSTTVGKFISDSDLPQNRGLAILMHEQKNGTLIWLKKSDKQKLDLRLTTKKYCEGVLCSTVYRNG